MNHYDIKRNNITVGNTGSDPNVTLKLSHVPNKITFKLSKNGISS